MASDITILDYDHDRDYEAVRQVWLDVGWLEADDLEDHEEGLKLMLGCSNTVIFPIDGVAECAVISHHGHMRYQSSDLNLGVVAGVTTGHVARRMGAARKLTADTLAILADQGAEIAALGMFDQGFYNQVGFGTGSYVSQVHFDPNTLNVSNRFRPPKRLAEDNWRDMHTAMKNRQRPHGGCWLIAPEIMQAEYIWTDNPFGLGYYDGPDGTLSHFFFGESEGQHGPYKIQSMAYQNNDQLFELLALIKSLGDQINKVQMEAPAELQFQDLLDQPFRLRRMTEGSEHENWHEVNAIWQARILDLTGCMAKTSLDAETLRFNLTLNDPATNHFVRNSAWRGVAGDYVITLGKHSSAEPGRDTSLPTLTAGVGAFTRAWLGVRRASDLALTDEIAGSAELLAALDRTLQLPEPHLGWDF